MLGLSHAGDRRREGKPWPGDTGALHDSCWVPHRGVGRAGHASGGLVPRNHDTTLAFRWLVALSHGCSRWELCPLTAGLGETSRSNP